MDNFPHERSGLKYKIKYKGPNPRRNRFYTIAVILSLFLMVGEINLYRKTLIDPADLLLLAGLVGAVAVLIDFPYYKTTYDGKFLKLWSFLVNSLIWGNFAVLLLLSINFYGHNSSISTENYSIIDRFTMAGGRRNRGKRKPVFVVEIVNKKKDLVFSPKFSTDMEAYSWVAVSTSEGYFGYTVILDQKLLKRNWDKE